jgi:hypothetical protein
MDFLKLISSKFLVGCVLIIGVIANQFNFETFSNYTISTSTGYGLDGPDRIPVKTRVFAHVQTGSGANPASCTMGTGSFLGVKRPGRGADK